MKTCIHCGYSAPGTWTTCPACAQPVPDAPGGAPPMGPGAPFPGGAPAPRPAASYGPSPSNPYAAPSAERSQPVPYYLPGGMTLPTSGKAIASLVLGILSIALIYFGVILGPLAIGFYASARKDLSQVPPTCKGQGINVAGLVTGIIGTLMGLLIIASIAAFVCTLEKAKRGEGF